MEGLSLIERNFRRVDLSPLREGGYIERRVDRGGNVEILLDHAKKCVVKVDLLFGKKLCIVVEDFSRVKIELSRISHLVHDLKVIHREFHAENIRVQTTSIEER